MPVLTSKRSSAKTRTEQGTYRLPPIRFIQGAGNYPVEDHPYHTPGWYSPDVIAWDLRMFARRWS